MSGGVMANLPTKKKSPRQAKATIKEIEAIKSAGRHSVGTGLILVVSPSGRKSWIARVRDPHGKRRDIGLGSYPSVSLSEARERVEAFRKQARDNLDPVAEKKRIRHAEGMPTFERAAAQAHLDHKGSWRNTKHRAQWLSTLRTYAYPAIGNLRVDQITGPMIRDLLLPVWLEKPETARRVKQRIGAVLDWAYAKGYRDQEAPLRSISKGLPRQPKRDGHFAALPYDDVPALMSKLAVSESIGRLALRFLILTAARSGEVRGARWDEIDVTAKTWTVPAERMKAGRQHIVPLSETALDVLKVAEKAKALDQSADDKKVAPLVFPGLRGKPLSDMTLAKVLHTATKADATVHGFRSSFRDWVAEETSFAGEVAEKALAHAIPNKVEAAYKRTDFLEKRRKLMDAWADFCTGDAGKVIRLEVRK